MAARGGGAACGDIVEDPPLGSADAALPGGDKVVSMGPNDIGQLEAVVNNAGYGLVGTFESMGEEAIRRQFETNVFGLMRVCRAALPQLRGQNQGRGGGVLINVASMGGRLTFPFYSVYHASKWAVEGFSESLAFEVEALGVRVKIIEPGAIKTDFYSRSAEVAHNRALSAYNEIVDRGTARMKKLGANGAEGAKASKEDEKETAARK
jgi:NAD(P)-dependent dehydrogenase (short-subunit alcohol dehydrogenase family)